MSHFGSQQAKHVLADAMYINMSLVVINAPDPAEHEWVINNGEIELKWMSINCGCKTRCESNRCGCKRANLHCSELCKCENCNNSSHDSDDEEDMINSNYEDGNTSDDE